MSKSVTPERTDAGSSPAAPARRGAGLPATVLAVTIVVAALLVLLASGLAREYGDTSAPDIELARRAVREWALGILVVGGLAVLVAVTARKARGRRAFTLGAGATVALTLLAVPVLTVVAVHRKFDAYPVVPSCARGFTSGPAVPVVRAAQDAFEEIEHPGPFSGGGESGVDGCASLLMVRGEVDVAAAYRRALPAAGWRLGPVEPGLVKATRGELRFRASRIGDEAWEVAIRPAGRVAPSVMEGIR